MILKGLKRNAIKKSIETYLKNRDSSSKSISGLNTLAFLIDASLPVNMPTLNKLAAELGVTPQNFKVVGYLEDEKEFVEDTKVVYYNDKSFGVKGAIKNESLKEFIDKDYDVLINFYAEDKIELHFVAAASKAKFKVGFAEVDNRINDLIIGSATNNTNLFMTELKKYLKILQII